MTIRNSIIPILLLIQTIYCWWCFITAKMFPYDENYGILMQAILISVLAAVIILIKGKWLSKLELTKAIFWLWFFVGSPLIYVLALLFYSDLFGSLQT